MYNSMSRESFAPLRMEIFPHEVCMALWEAYGDPWVPPFLEEILSPVNPVMVTSTPNEITHPNTPIDSTNLVPAINAPDSVQHELPCLPTSASWDDFLLDIAMLFVESSLKMWETLLMTSIFSLLRRILLHLLRLTWLFTLLFSRYRRTLLLQRRHISLWRLYSSFLKHYIF